MKQVSNSILGVLGSLWFATVLLVLLMVAMGSATVYESEHGSELALHGFYHSWWFRGLLALVAVNALAAIASRFPISARHVGFLLTHGGILLILGGALATKYLSLGGRVGIPEGRTVSAFEVPQPTLSVVNRKRGAGKSIHLNAGVFGGVAPVDRPSVGSLDVDGLTKLEVLRYLPDTVWERRVTDDGTAPQPAVEVKLGDADAAWVPAGDAVSVGKTEVLFRVLDSADELQRLISGRNANDASKGRIRVEHAGATAEIPLEDCMSKPAVVKGTPFRIKVLRYLPHAIVNSGKEVTNASDEPVNPAIEVEIASPDGTSTVLAFARFPDFGAQHGKDGGPKVTFVDAAPAAPAAPVELLSGPAGDLFVRFRGAAGKPTGRAVQIGEAVPTPWPGKTLTVERRFSRARTSLVASLPATIGKERTPAILVKLLSGGVQREVWVPHQKPAAVVVGGNPFEVRFGFQSVALGFEVRLNRFHLRTYPGSRRPRSFESHVTIVDPKTGGSDDRIISMNNPTSHGGFTFYQSSYSTDARGSTTYLSISRDPDQWIVFAGFILTIVGMIWVMVTRMREQRRLARMQQPAAGG